MSEFNLPNPDEEILIENREIVEDITIFDPSDIIVYSRDWTIETILSQIKGDNIDLNPQYQRRNAWNDNKRSILIESILIGYPVPEIVLAEDTKQKKSFAVIDGKQRLLTIAGFVDPEKYNYWDNPTLKGLNVKGDLNKLSFSELSQNTKYAAEFRQFMNASLRCTIITNFKENDVLYDIFYRLNSGSTPLATQELRQVLNRGKFANYLISTTNVVQPLHLVLNLDEPDKRLRDIEILLRCISIILFNKNYKGNLKVFLDQSMEFLTDNWNSYEAIVGSIYSDINVAIENLRYIFDGDYSSIGRKYTNGKLEKRFNRVLFEVQVFYFTRLNPNLINTNTKDLFITNFKQLCQDNDFKTSIESSTKNINNYKVRFAQFENLINTSFNCSLTINPFN